MYIHEFNLLWKKQETHYPTLLTRKLWDRIFNILFYQRNIYWRQSTIGKCEFEQDEYRCPKADRLAQEFRFLQEINNLKYIDDEAGDEIRVADDTEALQRILKEARKREKITFDKIRDILGLTGTDIRFNLESGKRKKNKQGLEEDIFRSDLKAFETDALLRKEKYFGKNWDKIPDEERNKIVRILLEKPMNPELERPEFDAKGRAKQMPEEQFRDYIDRHWKQWGLNDEQMDALLDIENEFQQGHLNLSRKAIRKILPHMQQGLLFSGPQEKDGSYNDALHQAGYVRKDEESDWETFDFLPQTHEINELGEINNPVVRRIVNEVRRMVNAIIKVYGRPDRIHLELAREAKASADQRKKMQLQNKQNRDEREEARNRIKEFEEYKVTPTHDAILRYRLWQQQNKICPYSGQSISCSKLWGGEIDIDHILPYSRTLDDSQTNKVVCFSSANRDKGDKSPYEWLASNYPQKYEELIKRIKDYPFLKRNKFLQKEIDTDQFTQRQLNDTKYAAKYMMDYLRCLFTSEEWKAQRRVLTVKGIQTSELRHFWGLNMILHNSDFLSDDLPVGEKNRGDHRHHAIDALVIALTDTRQLKRLAIYKYHQHRKSFPPPWSTFRYDAEKSINKIIVSHRPAGRVRGGLHNDTNYGPTYQKNGEQKNGEYVVRKKLTDLTAAEFFKIRDPRIKELVFRRLAEHGIVPIQKGKKEDSQKIDCKPSQIKEAFAKPLYLEPKKGVQTGTHLSEIKKVRIVVKDETFLQLKDNGSFVKPGSNHHITMFEKQENGQAKRYAIFTTRLEANRRLAQQRQLIKAKQKELENTGERGENLKRQLQDYRKKVVTSIMPIIQRFDPSNPNAKFLFSIKRGELFCVRDGNDEKLVIFKTAPSTTKNFCFIDCRDARKEPQLINKRGESYNDIVCKYCVDRLGNVYPAKD